MILSLRDYPALRLWTNNATCKNYFKALSFVKSYESFPQWVPLNVITSNQFKRSCYFFSTLPIICSVSQSNGWISQKVPTTEAALQSTHAFISALCGRYVFGIKFNNELKFCFWAINDPFLLYLEILNSEYGSGSVVSSSKLHRCSHLHPSSCEYGASY